MFSKKIKKRRIPIILIVFILLLCSLAYAQNQAPTERVFRGAAKITAGRYEDYFLRVLTGKPVIYTKPGETVYFKMYARKGADNIIVHDVQILDNDEKFVLTIKPEVIKQIRNIDMVVLSASLYVPKDTEHGTYPLRINVKGKEFVEESYPLDTKIKVGKHANIFDFIYIILAAALIGIVVYRIINIKKLGK